MTPSLHFSGKIVHYPFIWLTELMPCAITVSITIWSSQGQRLKVSALVRTSPLWDDIYTVSGAPPLPPCFSFHMCLFLYCLCRKGAWRLSVSQPAACFAALGAPALGRHLWLCPASLSICWHRAEEGDTGYANSPCP